MKKALALVLVVVLAFTLFGCAKKIPTPTETVVAALEAEKAKGREEVEELGILDEFDNEEFANMFVDMLLEYEYEVANEVIDGDNATVDVTIKTYDFAKSYEVMFERYFEAVMDIYYGGEADDMSEDEVIEMVENLLYDIWTETLNEVKAEGKTTETTFSIDLTKGEAGWDATDFSISDEFANALLGGLIDAMANA